MRSTLPTALVVAGMAAACGAIEEGDERPPSDPWTRTAEQQLEPPCTLLACSNSPELLYRGVLDAHLLASAGERVTIYGPNGRGQLYKNGVAYDMVVQRGRIRGIRNYGKDVIEGAQLAGADFLLMRDGAILYYVRIWGARQIAAPRPPAEMIEVYRMTWWGNGTGPSRDQPVCSPLTWDPDRKYAGNELLGMGASEVLAFEGDRIDPIRKEMSGPGMWDKDRVNFGCGGRAVAKLYLNRFTAASLGAPDSEAAWRQRQAMLKLLAADYCGTGRELTVTGIKLFWRSPAIPYLYPPGVLEARWTHKGAACLGVPRLRYHPAIAQQFGDLDAEIAATCPWLPPCSGSALDHDGEELTSANPIY